jgi:hypothetical protein
MKCGLQVLNHGDVWTNNMMFKLDTKEVLLIDYQLSFWGSPAYDILAFLAASVHDDVKVKHFDDLVDFYYQEFTETLRKLEYPEHIPTFEEFKEDLMEKGFIRKYNFKIHPQTKTGNDNFFYNTVAGFLEFLFFIKSSTEFSFDMLMHGQDEEALQDVYNRLYQDELLIKAVKVWLPFMDERGFLDALISSDEPEVK